MLHLVPYDQERITSIAKKISEAFMQEAGTYPLFLDQRNCDAYMQCVVTMLVKSHCLYEWNNEGGWIAYYDKKHAIGMMSQLQFATDVIFHVDLVQYEKVTKALEPWMTCQNRFAKSKDYLSVFLVCVPKQQQGKGHFRAMMQHVIRICDERNIPCILDTDSVLKKEKYEHIGMQCIASMDLMGGAQQYAMVYEPKFTKN